MAKRTKKKVEEETQQHCKLVAISMLWINTGTEDMPMFMPGPSHEYVIGWYDHPPSMEEISTAINKYLPFIQAKVDEANYEVYCGYEIYPSDTMTNLENFQFQVGLSIDFPSKDLTAIELPERVSLALPNRE